MPPPRLWRTSIREFIICILTWCGNEQPRHSTCQIARPVSTPSSPQSGCRHFQPHHNPKAPGRGLGTEGTHRGEGIEGGRAPPGAPKWKKAHIKTPWVKSADFPPPVRALGHVATAHPFLPPSTSPSIT